MARPVTPIRLAVAASGCTQREVAEAAGIDETRLSRIVNGRDHCPDPDLRRRLAVAVGREVDELFPEHGVPANTAAVSSDDPVSA